MSASRPFVDRPVGDVSAAHALARIVGEAAGLPQPTALRAGMNVLYRAGDVVIRVGRPSARADLALDLAEALRGHGLPVPTPASREVWQAGELSATCWEWIEPGPRSIDWHAVGAVVAAVHRLRREQLPADYPCPSPSGFPWWDFDALLSDVAGEIDAAALRGLAAAIERHRGWERFDASTAVVCHGDVHPGNVLMTNAGPVLLDWDLLCTAPPAWDHAMLLTLASRWGGDPQIYPQFSAGYGRSFDGDAVASGFAELRNVAATLMRVRAGRTDPAAADEAGRRLRFWRGEAGAPVWAAQ